MSEYFPNNNNTVITTATTGNTSAAPYTITAPTVTLGGINLSPQYTPVAFAEDEIAWLTRRVNEVTELVAA